MDESLQQFLREHVGDWYSQCKSVIGAILRITVPDHFMERVFRHYPPECWDAGLTREMQREILRLWALWNYEPIQDGLTFNATNNITETKVRYFELEDEQGTVVGTMAEARQRFSSLDAHLWREYYLNPSDAPPAEKDCQRCEHCEEGMDGVHRCHCHGEVFSILSLRSACADYRPKKATPPIYQYADQINYDVDGNLLLARVRVRNKPVQPRVLESDLLATYWVDKDGVQKIEWGDIGNFGYFFSAFDERWLQDVARLEGDSPMGKAITGRLQQRWHDAVLARENDAKYVRWKKKREITWWVRKKCPHVTRAMMPRAVLHLRMLKAAILLREKEWQRATDHWYYVDVWGWDPTNSRERRGAGYKYEAFFPLSSDPQLEGVEIGARVIYGKKLGTQNRIVFRQSVLDWESSVTCTHTAVWSGYPGDLPEHQREFARSTEASPVQLPPEEHFVALRSYVQGVAEVGIGNMLKAFYRNIEGVSIPFGFNSAMQEQVLKALRDLGIDTSEVCYPAVKSILKHASVEWITERLSAGELGHLNFWASTRDPAFVGSLSPALQEKVRQLEER